MAIAGFLFFLILFALIGLLSTRGQATDEKSYLLAGGNVSPLMTALSAAATKYSGYMFIGLMGYVYLNGLSAVWLVCGFFFGDFISFSRVPAAIRKATGRTGALSFAQLISCWQGKEYRTVRIVIGVLTLVFLTTYAAAQLSAGGKALQALFNWPAASGAFIGAGLILVYCLTGGLRASIWTDAAQSILMMAAMALLLGASVHAAGSWGDFVSDLRAVSPGYLDLGPQRFGSIGATALFAFGWIFNGLGVTGQPPVMVRFMALDKVENTRTTGIIYFLWSGTFLSLTLMVGLAARLYVSGGESFDAELALPSLAQSLLPELAIGIVIGGIFAASLSTTDSQILSCSAVLSEDFSLLKKGRNSKQFATLIIVCAALVIAVSSAASVFTLVILSWSALAATVGALVLVLSFGGRPSQKICLLMMTLGLTIVLVWRQMGWNSFLYEGAPGILGPVALYFLTSRLGWSQTDLRDSEKLNDSQ